MKQTDKDLLIKWAQKSSSEYRFEEISPEIDSYYSSFDNTENLMEFGFNNIKDLLYLLNLQWENEEEFEECSKLCSIIAFRNKPEQDAIDESKSTYVISDFVYMF